MRRFGRWWVAILWVLVTSVATAGDDAAPGKEAVFDDAALEFFEKEVRPLLNKRCLECHGNGKGDPQGGLSLTSRTAALKGGDTGPAVVPGKTKESLLVSAIEYGDIYQMPPKSKMPANEIATLKKWVELGAPWPKEADSTAGKVKPFDLATRKSEHWCWQPIANPPLPTVKDQAWPISTIDRFILADLEAKGLKPAGVAEKHALLRRVYFDVIGLPPTPEEVAAFESDNSPQALEKVVDRLLGSVHFGERWARHWLDLVRYAETRGHEFEPIIPNAWQYRDYVIRAINSDVPYDRFLMEHVAGDLIEPRWSGESQASRPSKTSGGKFNEGVLGTGFWFLGEEVHSPVDIRKDETDRMDNRLDVMSKTFLGLTVGCARCHDHKFDAISQRDYYAMTGFLISGSYRQVRVQTQDNDRQIAQQLDEARSLARIQIASSLVQGSRPVVEKLDQYLLAARQAVDEGISFAPATTGSAAPVVFADFEKDTYGDWKAEGTAFGDRPPRKGDNTYNAPLEGFQGERLVNSHRNAIDGMNDAGRRDAHTGKLTSPVFTIDHDTIRFLVGGGAHAGKTCINLEVDGKAVRTATGQNSGTLRPEKWSVGDLRGKLARIEIVDAEPGGWGHILVDQITFANERPGDAAPGAKLPDETRRKLGVIASASSLDVDMLAQWWRELLLAKSDSKHWLHGLMTATPTAPASQKPVSAPAGLVVDFAAAPASSLIQDGVSFGMRPTRPGQLQVDVVDGRPSLALTSVGAWERDDFWKNLKLAPGTEDDHGTLGNWHRHGRMVRTPEFTLTSDRLWYLVRGTVRAYASVNSHLVVAGPLHGSVVREFKHADDQWHWVAHGLELYRGHRMHIEFLPDDAGQCQIAMVVQGEAPGLPVRNPDASLYAAEAPANRPARLKSLVTDAVAWIEQRQLPSPETRPDDSSMTPVADWIVEHRSLFVPPARLAAIDQRMLQLAATEASLARNVNWESSLAPAMLDGNGIDELLLIRGNSSTPRDAVHRRFLEALGSAEVAAADGGSGRVELGRQMIGSPLAARVAVNRIWHHLFGRGIVPTVDNMGVLGQPPTHPALLDHLAIQFQQDGWSTKRLMKALLLSQTYRMSSHPTEPGDTVDPNNLLWHRMPIKRLEGEVIRDSLLSVAGRLDRTPFGPSVPIHLTPFMEGRGRPASGPVDGNGRRSIYISVRRNFLSPMMLAFDTPSPFSTVGRRTTSNVPAQALILMNDPLVIDMSKRWADRLLADSSQTTEQRIDSLYLTAFARKPTAAERVDAIEFLDSQSARLGIADSKSRSAPQAWADLCHVMINVKEFVFIE